MGVIENFDILSVGVSSVKITMTRNIVVSDRYSTYDVIENYKETGETFFKKVDDQEQNTFYRLVSNNKDTGYHKFTETDGTQIATISYSQGGTGNTTSTVTLYMYYETVHKNYGWGTPKIDEIESSYSQKTGTKTQNSSTKVRVEKNGWTDTPPTNEYGKEIYKYKIYTYTWRDTGTSTSESSEVSSSKTFYPHPASFSFINCTAGNKWRVDEGINSLITNINSFQGYAKQRMAWKKWPEPISNLEDCPSLFNSDKKISAAQLNAVYEYLGKTTSYQSGEKLSAAMLNGIADLINDKE